MCLTYASQKYAIKPVISRNLSPARRSLLIFDCRKAIESAQSAADLKLHLEKYHAQIKEVQQTVAEKTSSLEAEAFKTKRLHEELVLMRRKVG